MMRPPATIDGISVAQASAEVELPNQTLDTLLAAVRAATAGSGAALLQVQGDQLRPVACTGLEVGPRALDDAALVAESEVAYPLLCAGRVEGVLLIGGIQADEMVPRDDVLACLLDLAAIALRNSRLSVEREQADVASRKLRADAQASMTLFRGLHEISVATSGALDLHHLATLVGKHALRFLAAAAATVRVWDPGDQLLRVLYSSDPLTLPPGSGVPPDHGFSGQAFRERHPVVVNDYDNWGQACPNCVALGVRAALAVPLMTGDWCVGVMTVTFHQPEQCGVAEVETLSLLAALIAPAINAARLHREIAEHAREAAMKKEELATILDQMSESVVVVDLASRVTLANQAAAALRGVTAEPMLGLQIANQIWLSLDEDGRPQPPSHRPLERALRGQRGTYDQRLITAAGQERLIWSSAAPLRDSDGHIRGAVKVSRDITQERQRQQQLLESEKHRALGQLAGGVAHDFNNALAMIMGYSELLLTRSEQREDQEKVREAAQIIHTVAGDAASVVRRLGTLYRLGDETGESAPMYLDQLAAEAVQMTRPKWHNQALARACTIEVQTALQPVRAILGQAAELREALTNLIFNAVDAMPTGGMLCVNTREQDGRAVLEVADTGAGMSEHVRQRCLEPFFTTKGEAGTGLGLATVHSIVRRHQGELEIASLPGQGTTFHLSFPLDSSAVETETNSSRIAVGRPLQILVVEDEPLLRDLLVQLLAADGHQIQVAGDGEQGIQIFALRQANSTVVPFDLVITDRAMPKFGGDRLAVLIKQLESTMPVLMVTGFGESMQAANEQPEGVDLVVSKPVTLQQLREAVQALVAPMVTE